MAAPTHTVALRPNALGPDQLAAHGWHSLADAARACGVARTTLQRVAQREVEPTARTVAALLRATGKPFEEVFELTPVQ